MFHTIATLDAALIIREMAEETIVAQRVLCATQKQNLILTLSVEDRLENY